MLHQVSTDSIRVAVRSRPLTDREKVQGQVNGWKITKNTLVPLESRGYSQSAFTFGTFTLVYFKRIDYVLGSESCNLDIYNQMAKDIIHSVMNGFNGTIFAYGQTRLVHPI